jgi:hypothetical protein
MPLLVLRVFAATVVGMDGDVVISGSIMEGRVEIVLLLWETSPVVTDPLVSVDVQDVE